MNLLLLEPDEIDGGGAVILAGRRADHLRRILGVEPGDRIRVGVIRDRRGIARVVRVDDAGVELAVELETEAAAPPPIDVILAVPRIKALSRVLQTIASFGVRRIDLVNAWRVHKSYLSSARLERSRLRDDLVLGCEQGVTTWVPDIDVHRLLVPFLEGPLAERVASDPGATAVIAHPTAPLIEEVVSAGAGRVLLAIGPEGGWIEPELDSFTGLGFRAASAGPAVLRVESAVPALLGQIALLCRLGRAA